LISACNHLQQWLIQRITGIRHNQLDELLGKVADATCAPRRIEQAIHLGVLVAADSHCVLAVPDPAEEEIGSSNQAPNRSIAIGQFFWLRRAGNQEASRSIS
jgi:hypothetical protein